MKITTVKKQTSVNLLTYGMVIAAYLLLQILLSGGHISSSLKGQLIPICAYVVMAVSLNLTVGVLGELSLGHAGFMSIGAFAGAVACISLESLLPGGLIRMVVAMLAAALCAGVAGALIGIPVLRLKGDYLAIVTLAFGEIIKNLINCLYVAVDTQGLHINFLKGAQAFELEGGRIIIDGPMGIANIPKLSTFTLGVALILVTLFIVLNLVNSRSGRAIMALRDNRIAAESIGIPITKYKMMAFVTSAALAGAAGALYAMNYSTVVAAKFNFTTSILVLVFVVLGGLGRIWGSIVAATLLTILPELLREFNDYRMLVYAVVLVLVMIATNNDTFKGMLSRLRERILPKKQEEGLADE